MLSYLPPICFFVITSYSALTKNYKILIFLVLFFLTNDLFRVPMIASVNYAFFITGLYLPEIFCSNRFFLVNAYKGLKYVFYEWYILLVLAVLFGWLFPWVSVYDYARSWSQLSGGRALISVVRIFLEITLIVLSYYWVFKGRISQKTIVKIVCAVITINFLIAVGDYFSGNLLKAAFFPGDRIITGRFTGFCGEPRSFGRGMGVGVIVLLLAYISGIRVKYHVLFIFIAFLSVFISFSVSSFFAVFISLIFVTFVTFINKRSKINSRFLFVSLCVMITFTCVAIINKNNVLESSVLSKVKKVLIGNFEDKMSNEPYLLTRFEVFDRAALNFLYHNPQYILFGVGPNLISIPASDYVSPYAMTIYKEGINSVPHTGIVNLIARSGLCGFLLYVLFYRRLYLFAKKNNMGFSANLFCALSMFFMLVKISLIYFVIGLFLMKNQSVVIRK